MEGHQASNTNKTEQHFSGNMNAIFLDESNENIQEKSSKKHSVKHQDFRIRSNKFT